jgi:O-antigen ligase
MNAGLAAKTAGGVGILAVALTYYFDRFLWEALLLLAAALYAAILWRKELFDKGFPLLVLALPISFGLRINDSTEIEFPAEFLLLIAAPIVLLHLIKERFKSLRSHPFPLLWIATFALPVLWSDQILVSLKFTLLNALYVLAFYYGTLLWKNRGGEFHRLVFTFALGMVPVTLLGVWRFVQFEFNPVTLRGLYEPFFYSHTYFGATAALLAAYFLGRWRLRLRYVLLFMVFAVLTVLSGSRAALWSLLIALFFALLLQLPLLFRWLIPLLGVGVITALVIVGHFDPYFERNSFESHDPQASIAERSMSVTNLNSDVSNRERLNRWIAALRMFQERPHWGFGPGTYQFTYIPYQEHSLQNRLTVRNPDHPPEGSGGTAHSELLLQLSENGWPSTLLFLVLLGRWFLLGIRRFDRQSAWMGPLFLGLVTYFFHMQVNNFLNQPAFAFLFWSFGAMITEVHEKQSAEG